MFFITGVSLFFFISCESIIQDGYRDASKGECIIEAGNIELSTSLYSPFITTSDLKMKDSGNVAGTITTTDGPAPSLNIPGISTGLLPQGSGLTSGSITDMAGTIAITGTYYGSKTPVNCLIKISSGSIPCLDYKNITITRQEISDVMGDAGSATLRVIFDEDGIPISSNPVNVRKYKIRQISDTRNSNGVADNPLFLKVYNGKLYFSAINSAGFTKLFMYNEADDTVAQISDIFTSGNDSPGYLTVYNNRLYFYAAIDNFPTRKLFRYDEAANIIQQISDTRNGSSDFFNGTINPFAVVGSNLYMVAYSSTGYDKVFGYNDSAHSIVQVPNTRTDHEAVGASNLIDYNNAVYFSANMNGGYVKLFRYDGTKTEQVSNIITNNSDSPKEFVLYKDELYFNADSGNGYTKLFRYNALLNNITRVSNTRNNASAADNPQYLTVYNNRLYFSAANTGGYTKLYCYDGTAINQISDIRSGNSDNPAHRTLFNNKLYFSATNSSGYTKLFSYDGTTITELSNTNPVGSDNPANLTVYNGRLYFSALNAGGFTKLFRME
jgi:hypothetical protein